MDVKISGFYDETGFALDEQLAILAELKENYMCPRIIDGKNISKFTAEEFIRNIKPKLDAAGVKFSSIGSPIGKVAANDEEGFKRQLVELKELIAIAEAMDCEYIRIFSFFIPRGREPQEFSDSVIAKMKELVALAENSRVTLLHENEKHIYGDTPERELELIEAVGSQKLKLAYDASNFIQVGVDPLEAWIKVRDHVVYVHIKDCDRATKVEMPMGMGDSEYKEIFADLKSRGYNGFMTLEPHTGKYAVLRKPVYFIPFMPLILNGFFRAFRKIDKACGFSVFRKVTRKDMFKIQYYNLKKYLEEAK